MGLNPALLASKVKCPAPLCPISYRPGYYRRHTCSQACTEAMLAAGLLKPFKKPPPGTFR